MDTSGSILGKIQWKNKAIEINGIVISTNLIKSKKGTFKLGLSSIVDVKFCADSFTQFFWQELETLLAMGPFKPSIFNQVRRSPMDGIRCTLTVPSV
jgi:hypothetical protein